MERISQSKKGLDQRYNEARWGGSSTSWEIDWEKSKPILVTGQRAHRLLLRDYKNWRWWLHLELCDKHRNKFVRNSENKARKTIVSSQISKVRSAVAFNTADTWKSRKCKERSNEIQRRSEIRLGQKRLFPLLLVRSGTSSQKQGLAIKTGHCWKDFLVDCRRKTRKRLLPQHIHQRISPRFY